MNDWYEDREHLAFVARHMADRGDTAADVAYMLEKPWKFEDEWHRANLRLVEGMKGS